MASHAATDCLAVKIPCQLELAQALAVLCTISAQLHSSRFWRMFSALYEVLLKYWNKNFRKYFWDSSLLLGSVTAVLIVTSSYSQKYTSSWHFRVAWDQAELFLWGWIIGIFHFRKHGFVLLYHPELLWENAKDFPSVSCSRQLQRHRSWHCPFPWWGLEMFVMEILKRTSAL